MKLSLNLLGRPLRITQTGGLSGHVPHVLKQLAEFCVRFKQNSDFSEQDMKELMEKIGPEFFCTRNQVRLTPKRMPTFCAFLIASILRLQFRVREMVYSGLHNRREYVLDVANSLDFYYVCGPLDESSKQSDIMESTVYPYNLLKGGVCSSGKEVYSFNACKAFYDKYLSEDGISFVDQDSDYGPSIIIRVTGNCLSSSDEENSSSERGDLEKRTYVIGISLKCLPSSSPGFNLTMLKEEIGRAVHPVSSQLQLKDNNQMAIELIISNKYSADISEQISHAAGEN
ncbi:hypothetical protein GAYE_SCF15G3602 [Galdieria yellowstonensis]|uniref:Uncharacterized protein n=1 Tax=Galdieria yellowstonensis TaxID=3028027 RepID=A0AAV9IE97_9RHOD|nr:hypothetical protein GAYE_SCF15G3602 [Galdieria yellowstonensis]